LAATQVAFTVVLQPTVHFLEDVSAFPMTLTVNSSNPDSTDTLEDNTAAFSLPVRVKTDLRIRGLPEPTLVTYNRSSYNQEDLIETELDIGPEVTHIYQVENRGPSDIESAEVYILWPALRGQDQPLLYLTGQPLVEGPGSCHYVSEVNTHNIKVERARGGDVGAHYLSRARTRPEWEEDDEEETIDSTNITMVDILTDSVRSQVLQRPKRLAVSAEEEEVSMEARDLMGEVAGDEAFLAQLNCGLSQCTFISCTIGPLAKKQFTLFKVKSRLWVRSLLEIPRTDIEISSKLVARVTKLPYGVNPAYLGHRTHLVTTQVLALEPPEAGSIPLWILILAILAGLLFLSILTAILYKLGFFRRKRPEDYNYQGTIQEKRPLGKESKNQMVPNSPHQSLLIPGPPSQHSQHSSQARLSSRLSGHGSVYYPGQRHPDMLPGDEAL